MSELFMNVSRTLRDELVTELKKQNDFLRKHAADFTSGKDVLAGAKVTVEEPTNAHLFLPNTQGILLSQHGASAVVLLRDSSGRARVTVVYFCHLRIEDPRIEKMLDDLQNN